MRVVHVNLSDASGGAAIACNRLHHGLIRLGVDSHLLVYKVIEPGERVHSLHSGFGLHLRKFQLRLTRWVAGTRKDPTSFHCSLNLFGGPLLKRIESLAPDLVHLHWVGANILPLSALKRIRQPVVWTNHDMWPFCGAEHYSYGSRWKTGYTRENRDPAASGFDLDRIVWRRKMRSWCGARVTHTGPSEWIMKSARASALWNHLPNDAFNVIPNGLDLKVFSPSDRKAARTEFGLEGSGPILLFGAFSQSSSIKGGDLLIDALRRLDRAGVNCELATFGNGNLEVPTGMKHSDLGNISDPVRLSKLYSAADLMLVPSRLESFGQTASEAHACGTPVVCFDESGIRDIVEHKETGYRAKAYSVDDFVSGIQWCLQGERQLELGRRARETACARFDIDLVSERTVQLYNRVLGSDD